MKTYLLPSIKLTLILIVLTAGIYPLAIAGIGKFTPGKGDGETITYKGRVVGYANIGQKFTKDEYFWGRPSAVDYNAAGSGGSNKGPSNPDYLKQVEGRIDDFLKHNPGVTRSQIPAELVTASGSGLDPDLSPAGAKVQVARVAKVRGLSVDAVNKLVDEHTEQPLLGLFGPAKVNVLKLNVALDRVKK
ncbi:K(+)-transporting ATPase subunit C [Mucilaginibacter rubeus]|uniref:Potassium-transporting ATPase KdpC subunit n=1 Tax=Mucilaginibacter rubeus TaxID=2027860 RepID=A0AAE6JGC9_9SPHI|nr:MULTISPECIES: K(+)-transporting ATPase subunit C [Mucilaginibacter]QEM05174.1 K(+)-transporting ATPase subunit C [Mucilaginibacter rubeus]QEM17767.1 K(+)-transporting ATPase subunit C [Mucilaginibacter gossypii]QTE45706.1 K(+)-transporting ATPase subunit C [Mucilaginibacter rubeus]QTE52303.1 K(+)-transporting ATPase subunit C [Mucilaginibacter rubeus]QTE57392.1 K(+)-transporting ATPase subunit C [Mucilaginibacter rubeus]